MNDTLLHRIKYSPLSRVATLPMRARMALWPALRQTTQAAGWVLGSREWANVAYNYRPIGIRAMAAALSLATAVDRHTIAGYARELTEDALYADRHLDRVTRTPMRHIADPELRFSRGLYFYMLVRAAKTRLAFEAGTDKGYSSLAICRAMARNAQESGIAGHLVTVDIKDDRGHMLDGDEGGTVTRLTGDCVRALAAFDRPIDFFIHDTVNETRHTRDQFDALRSKLSPSALLHTSWFNEDFTDFCDGAGLSYLEVVESPTDPMHPGNRYGLAWQPAAGQPTGGTR